MHEKKIIKKKDANTNFSLGSLWIVFCQKVGVCSGENITVLFPVHFLFSLSLCSWFLSETCNRARDLF